jgi:hypothetical protein
MAVTSTTIKTKGPAPAWRRVSTTSLLSAGTYALALIALVVLAQHLGAWAQLRIDDVRYGTPRTVQASGVVGGGDSPAAPTRFIGLNLGGQTSVLVLPAGDTSRTVALQGPYVIGQDGAAAVPLLALADVNGDGGADLLLTIRGETVVYLNHDGTFALITAEERAQLQPPGGQ